MTTHMDKTTGGFRFCVEVDGAGVVAFFNECNLPGWETEVIEYREGGENTTVRQLPGMTKYSNIVLKWGMSADMELYDWHRQIVLGEVVRKDGSIIVLDRQGNEVARWNFVRAWPTKYDIPDFNASGNEVAIETLELAHEGVERVG